MDAARRSGSSDRHALIARLEPVHRLQQRRLVGPGGVELGGHAAAVQADDAVADERDLGQLAREQQHGGAVAGKLPEERVDLALRADVDPARRIEAEERLEPVCEPARDRDLLLVAPREPADLALRTRIDRERLDRRADPPPLRPHVDGTPPGAGC